MSSPRTFALVGNPNTGKTTLFNALTGLRQKVANYPGVTVEKKTGLYSHAGDEFHLTDLPGIYALDSGNDANSIDESIASNNIAAGAVQRHHIANGAIVSRNVADGSIPWIKMKGFLPIK